MKSFKVYTGPTLVQTVSQILKRAGLSVTLEGTAHVYVDARNAADVLAALPEHGWTYKDVQETRF